jgi:FtsH-binding integral membrane protein
MDVYVDDENKLMAVSLIVALLGIIAILFSPFIFNIPEIFYACVVLVIIAGLYLSRNISHVDNTASPKAKGGKTNKAKRARKQRRKQG